MIKRIIIDGFATLCVIPLLVILLIEMRLSASTNSFRHLIFALKVLGQED